ncbi:MAG: hypothetical protein GY856_53805, partial [bacterium]|nr:hypothetical protein [bacterium]
MATNLKELGVIARDGTSQAARFLEALDPAYAPVDERTVEDLLDFARQLGAELPYYDADEMEDGDWSAFVDPRLKLEDVAAFMDAPEKFPPDLHPLLHRPHFVLFLTFLELLRRAQGELNGLTRRHLDFYYRQVLRMTGKPAIPDRVNLLFDLRSGVDQAMVPADTRLSAGPDSLGRERIYAIDRDLLVNRAQVGKLSSLALEQRVTGIREARESYRNDKAAGAVAMFEIALGDPLPGDPLPLYDGGATVDYAFLLDRHALVRFARDDLYMPIFDLRTMMELKLRRD